MASWNKYRKVHLKDTSKIYGLRCNRKPNMKKHYLHTTEKPTEVTCATCVKLLQVKDKGETE